MHIVATGEEPLRLNSLPNTPGIPLVAISQLTTSKATTFS